MSPGRSTNGFSRPLCQVAFAVTPLVAIPMPSTSSIGFHDCLQLVWCCHRRRPVQLLTTLRYGFALMVATSMSQPRLPQRSRLLLPATSAAKSLHGANGVIALSLAAEASRSAHEMSHVLAAMARRHALFCSSAGHVGSRTALFIAVSAISASGRSAVRNVVVVA